MTDKPLTPQERANYGRPPILTWDVFVAICARLKATGARYASCREFGISGNYVVQRIKKLADEGSPEWLELWEESLELFADNLETEMHRRAVEGIDKPVFYKGEEVGAIREYSDTLALALARAARPEKFRENVKVDANVTGGVLVVPERENVTAYLARKQAEQEGGNG